MQTHGIWICELYCHKQIHRFISEKDMGLKYNTLEKLLEQSDVKRFIEWMSKRV